MKEFFDKYGGGSREPYQALEMIIEKLCRAKEKIERGDSNVMNDLSDASNMLDDFAHEAKTAEFKPREYSSYRSSEYNPYRINDRIGYQQTQGHYFPMYPMYPIFEEGGRGREGGDGRPGRQGGGSGGRGGTRWEGGDYYPYPDQSEAYRRNQNRPNER